MANPDNSTLTFLRKLALTGNARVAAEAVGVPFAEICRRRLRDAEFAGLWVAALNMRERWLELKRRFPNRSVEE
jgi:hypothetical protein